MKGTNERVAAQPWQIAAEAIALFGIKVMDDGAAIVGASLTGLIVVERPTVPTLYRVVPPTLPAPEMFTVLPLTIAAPDESTR